ncbi:MAG TPA: NUDIX hydrolase [Pseudogracilibacillus sp.]|nr:NUDIX hydrolase [Pseudogracilibacillus sp.]
MVAVPKPASTVVLVDEQLNVFLTKRPKTMKFLGGFYVFPGGGMDEIDTKTKAKLFTGNLQDDLINKGYYIAAARELFEEVGILLGETSEGTSKLLTTAQIDAYREQLLSGDITFANLLESEQLLFNFNSLQYFGQITTPKMSPIRYDTKFFLAQIPDGQTPHLNHQEVDEAFWLSPEEGLRLYENKELLLAPPTIVVMESLVGLKNGESIELQNERAEYLAKKMFG